MWKKISNFFSSIFLAISIIFILTILEIKMNYEYKKERRQEKREERRRKKNGKGDIYVDL